MLLVLDINPHIERKLYGKDFLKGRVSYADKMEVTAGGYGAQLSKIMGDLMEQGALMTFLGSANGDLYSKDLMPLQLSLFVEDLKDNTQELIILREKNKDTKIFSKEPRLTREDIRNFYKLLKEKIGYYKVLILTENTRLESPDNIEVDIIKISRGASVPIILPFSPRIDYGQVIEARPYGMVIDRSDLEGVLGQEIHYIGQVIEGLKSIFGFKVPLILLTGGRRGSILFTENRIYLGQFKDQEEIDIDLNKAMFGLGLAISRKYEGEMTLKMALSMGKLNKVPIDFATLKSEMNNIKVETMEV